MGDLFSPQTSFYTVEILFFFEKRACDLIKAQSQQWNTSCIDRSLRKLIVIVFFQVTYANKKYVSDSMWVLFINATLVWNVWYVPEHCLLYFCEPNIA